jgi:hypothetical protein
VTDHQREDAIDRLLRSSLERSAQPAPTSVCVDAETLAAWIDGSLSGEELSTAEHHAAGCARCQAMLASMARTAPEPAARPAWRTLTSRWLVPIVATATALFLWIAVDRDRTAPVANPSKPSVPPSFAAPSPEASPRRPGAPADQPDRQPLPALIAPESRQAVDSVAPRLNPREKPADPRLNSRLEPRAAEVPRLDKLAAAETPGAMSSPPPPIGRSPVPSPPPAVPSAEPSPPTAGLSERVTTAADTALGQAGASRARQIDIVSPEPAFRWRLLGPATIQRSTDGGATWTTQSGLGPGLGLAAREQVAIPMVLTTGSAPARDICWIVGRAGVVLLSSSGTAWQRRPFPEAADLTAVRAVDARTAVVTAADGRQFSTADGGATWLKIP